ncbi:MAG: DUF4190 domain-containing protein [Pirellulales bacterium]
MVPQASNVEPTFDGHEAELEQYRSVSLAAIAALVLGLLSPLAVYHPVLWAIPLSGLAVSLVALAQLRAAESQLTGRKAARVGLALCLLFGAAGPARYFSRAYLVRREAERLTDAWMGYLRSGDPAGKYKAHQLLYDAGMRAPLDDSLPAFYQRNPEQARSLSGYEVEPPIRALLSLSPQAVVTWMGPIEHTSDGPRDLVIEQFRVSDPQGPEKEFYVQVSANRTQFVASRPGQWSIGKATKTLTPQ